MQVVKASLQTAQPAVRSESRRMAAMGPDGVRLHIEPLQAESSSQAHVHRTQPQSLGVPMWGSMPQQV